MTICRTCNVPMTEVRRFTSERNEKFQRCPKCYGETKHLKIFERENYILTTIYITKGQNDEH